MTVCWCRSLSSLAITDAYVEVGRVASRPGYPAEPAARSRPFGRVSLAPPLPSVAAHSVCPAARCAPRRCRNDTLVARFDGVAGGDRLVTPRAGAARRARRGARLARPGRLRRLRASPRLAPATRRASPVPASPSTGSRTARCTTRRTGVSARARAPAERPRTSLRTAPGSRVRTGADSAAGASAAVLRTTPCSSRCTSRPLKRRGGSDAPLSPAPISRTSMLLDRPS